MVRDATLPFVFDKAQPARFGLLPRNDTNESRIQWFDLPPTFIFHSANAWDEGPDIVKLCACCFDEVRCLLRQQWLLFCAHAQQH